MNEYRCSREGCLKTPTHNKQVTIGGHIFSIWSCDEHFNQAVTIAEDFAKFVACQGKKHEKA
jgi:hypothetical protein